MQPFHPTIPPRTHTARLGWPDAAQMITETLLRDQLPPITLGAAERRRIVQAARKPPEPAADGAAEIVLYP